MANTTASIKTFMNDTNQDTFSETNSNGVDDNSISSGLGINGNGRVNILGNNTSAVFALQDKIPTGKCTDYRNAMSGNWNETQLSRAFFSSANQQILQNGIRAGVFHKSNGKFIIGPQETDDLQIIMRGVFLQNARNQPNDIPGQIARLNGLVLEYAVPQVYNDAVSYIKYKRDVSTMWTPMQMPMPSDYSNKSLEMPRWF